MTGSNLSAEANAESVSLQALPKTAIQAIYHAVTGKTENMSKDLSGNVLIKSADIDRLYGMICDQMGHYKLKFAPTVTVTVKCENSKSITYSSWERYKKLSVTNFDVTSEFMLKIEFIIELPETNQDQRCVMNVSLDSSLPVVVGRMRRSEDSDFIEFLMMTRSQWHTAVISIDFVDFLVAKIFTAVVEEWFKGLDNTPHSKLNEFLRKNHILMRSVGVQFGRFGMAAFLLSYVAFFGQAPDFQTHTVIACAIGLAIWGVFSVAQDAAFRKITSRITSNIIPAVILLNDADEKSYCEVSKKSNSAILTLSGMLLTVILNVAVNVVSSYVFADLSKGGR